MPKETYTKSQVNKIVDISKGAEIREHKKRNNIKKIPQSDSPIHPGRLLTPNELKNFDEFMAFEGDKTPVVLPDISRGVNDFLKEFKEEMKENNQPQLTIIRK